MVGATRRRRRPTVLLAVAGLLAVSVVSPARAVTPPPAPSPACSEVRLAVALAENQPAGHEVAGQLCLPVDGRPSIIQVLVPGATYGRVYWDFPVDPDRHSWVRYMTAAGYATLALDRIGTGRSSHPPPEEVTVPASAFVVQQVVEAARDGKVTGRNFARVLLVGHSLGSVIALAAAARHGGVDALVLTGFLHRVDVGFGLVGAAQHPARLDDPRFRGLPPGYLTTRPGLRWIFYYPATTDSRVVAVDEATKDTLTDGESLTLGQELYEAARHISIPVLVVVGDRDMVFCTIRRCSDPGGAAEGERSFWSTGCYGQVVVPETGHALNLHDTAPEWFPAVRDWLAGLPGPAPGPAGGRSCGPSGPSG